MCVFCRHCLMIKHSRGLQLLFLKSFFFIKNLKVRVKSIKYVFCHSGTRGSIHHPLSVGKLHHRMSYHRHICRKHAMKLCGSCTTRGHLPPPTFTAFCSAACRGSVSVRQPGGCFLCASGRLSAHGSGRWARAENHTCNFLGKLFN